MNPVAEWRQEIPTEGTVNLPPDPRALNALGRNYQLETALADLVDNSVDAGASRILIRFIQHGTRLTGVYVVDDGRGIRPEAIDAAMTLGGPREYGDRDLGHFGLGLKAASFSQAASLTLLSRAAGRQEVGRRWLLDGQQTSYSCDRVSSAFAAAELDRGWPFTTRPSGTVVRWDQVRSFPVSDDPDRLEEFVTRTVAHLQGHLGLMFHRILAAGLIRLAIDVEDTQGGVGVTHEVTPIDPFGYSGSVPGWPKDLTADVDGVRVTVRCHIWPRRSSAPEYRLPGGAEQRQGLYFYRNDRLLHAGGWEGIHAPDKKLQLARASIDIAGDVAGLFVMNPEKSRVSAGPRFSQVVGLARANDGTDIDSYLRAAEQTWVASTQRATAKRSAVRPPGKGFHPKVIRVIRDELPQLNEIPLNIQWKAFVGDEFLEFDRDHATLWLNQAYRRALLGGRRGGLNDLPVLKAMLFLLAEKVFEGSFLGARDKDNIRLWQEILTAAAKAERTAFEDRT